MAFLAILTGNFTIHSRKNESLIIRPFQPFPALFPGETENDERPGMEIPEEERVQIIALAGEGLSRGENR